MLPLTDDWHTMFSSDQQKCAALIVQAAYQLLTIDPQFLLNVRHVILFNIPADQRQTP